MNEHAHIIDDLQSLAIPIGELTVDPSNARAHDERNIVAICASLKTFKQRHPVVVQKQGMVVRAGNGRVVAALRLGWTHIAAVVVDETEVEGTAFAIADNRTAELASWDWPELASQLHELDEAGFKVDDLGWDFDNVFNGDWIPAEEDNAGLDGDGKHTVALTPEQWEVFNRACARLTDLSGEKGTPGGAVVEFAEAWMQE